MCQNHRYVEEKYHPSHVSRVITFGKMAAKSAIKDVARINGVTIEESNRLAKLLSKKGIPSSVDGMFSCYDRTVTVPVSTALSEEAQP